MSNNPFADVRSRIPILELARLYGVTVDRANMCLCPVHAERNPSCKLYPAKNTWHCYGCGAGGSVIDLAMALNNTNNPKDIAQELSEMFDLHAFEAHPGRQVLKEKLAEKQIEKGKISRFDIWLTWAGDYVVADYCRLLRRWKQVFAPKTPEEFYTPELQYRLALKDLEYWTHVHEEIFLQDDLQAQIRFYATHIERIDEIAKFLDSVPESADAYRFGSRRPFDYEFFAPREHNGTMVYPGSL